MRAQSLRLLGFGVAVAILAAATQLVLLSFEADPLFTRERVSSISEWVQRPVSPGLGIVAGFGFGIVVLWLLWSFVRSLGVNRRVITTRRRNGATRIDRASLEAAFQRTLEGVDRRNDVDVTVTRRGRVDALITTPDAAPGGSARELRDVIDQVCDDRGLPCHSGRITATVPRRMNARRSIR